MFHLIHQTAHVGRYGEHTQRVEAAVEHVGLDAHFVEGFGEGTNGLVGVFAIEQVDLFEGTTVGFYAGEAAHLYDDRSNTFELVFARLEFAATLEHVAVEQAELDFTLCCHKYVVCLMCQR